MATIANAMKEVNLSSTSKTQGGSGSAALNDTDLVQLYDNAGNPNGKITKSALMDAVKASLPALLADQTTTGVNFPSINSSGILGKMTAANLASVLGVTKSIPDTDFNKALDNGTYNSYQASAAANAPHSGSFTMWILVVNNYDSGYEHIAQTAYDLNNNNTYIRCKKSGTWSGWKNVSTDIPSFYKDYSDLSSLASALGGLGSTNAHVLSDGDDVNNCNKTGIYAGSSEINVLNRPGTGSFRVICIASESNIWMQIGYNYNGEFYVRRKWGIGNITAWKQF